MPSRDAAKSVHVVTDRFVASAEDKQRIAMFLHDLGVDPARVTEVHMKAKQDGILVEITTRSRRD